jgi:predicted cupin superfamily sugar epimerase
MSELTAEEIIGRLELEPLDQEGGYFRQTWRSALKIPTAVPGFGCSAIEHTAGTAIYFLITGDQFSAMHRLKADEIWLHHLGDPLEMLMLHPDGVGELACIGPDLAHGQRPQHVCPTNSWQGTHITPGQDRVGYALGSCIMAPGFDWSEFELGDRKDLVSIYPNFADHITARTRKSPIEGKH